MSRLNELIAEYCPDGVGFQKLLSVANVLYGFPCSASLFNNDGMGAPLARIRDVLAGHSNIYTTEAIPSKYIISSGDLLIGMDGNFHVANWKQDGAVLCQRVCKVSSKDESVLLDRFLSHLLKPIIKKIEDSKQSGTVKHLLDKDIKAISVPVPPLPVQHEIVRILDNFTELTAELIANISTELSSRKKQYDYYRDLLLNTDTAPLVTLATVVKKSCAGATPKKGAKEYYEGGNIPWIRTQDVKFNEIYGVDSYITETAVRETAAKWIPENCVIVAISGASAGRCAINKIKATTNQHCLNLEIASEKALYKYVYYCVCSRYDELLSRKQGARGDLNSSLILGITIPLPSIEKQATVVKLLERFDKLLAETSSILPTEIEARQKQYEYYREKLLTFKELA